MVSRADDRDVELSQAPACNTDADGDEDVWMWCREAPYAKNPLLRWGFCTQLVLTTFLVCVPWWFLQALVGRLPRRPSWRLSESLLVPSLRRLSQMTEKAGVQHAIRDPAVAPSHRLKETRFCWVPGLRKELVKGAVVDDMVQPMDRVGCFVWGKSLETEENGSIIVHVHPDGSSSPSTKWVGGGYTHFSADEKSSTSKIPRRLMQSGSFASIYAVEYRLLPESPFPSALQDAAAVYAHLVNVDRIAPQRIIIIGDSAGGNIALALMRWIRDEGMLPKPAGMLLLSPWCDPAHAFYHTLSSHIPRPNAETDYLSDVPSARSVLVRSFLGSHRSPSFVTSPYISPSSPNATQAGSFTSFSPTFVHYGDAERLELEIEGLIGGLQRDGVEVDFEKTMDAPHDILMLQWWNESVRRRVYERIDGWLRMLGGGSANERSGSDASFTKKTVGDSGQ